MEQSTAARRETIIQPRSRWSLSEFYELMAYGDLFFFLAWRDIKALYAQTVLGVSWAVMIPLSQIVIFTIIFGKVARLSSEGVPYFLFSTVAIVPWTYISHAMTKSSLSLVEHQRMLGKIYFPRLIFPLTAVTSRLVDFLISLVIVLAVLVYYRVHPTWNLLLLPLFFVMMVSLPLSIGLWMSSLAIRFRDVKHGLPFFERLLMYTAPVVYSAAGIPESKRIWYSLNPLVGVVEGFRSCLLGTPMPWQYIYPGMVTVLVLLIGGFVYFRRMEHVFADVI